MGKGRNAICLLSHLSGTYLLNARWRLYLGIHNTYLKLFQEIFQVRFKTLANLKHSDIQVVKVITRFILKTDYISLVLATLPAQIFQFLNRHKILKINQKPLNSSAHKTRSCVPQKNTEATVNHKFYECSLNTGRYLCLYIVLIIAVSEIQEIEGF